ncbi:hypothetical protein G9A89_012026 [Geosiphon pyriformis]|nr:hypothetical protein G9A89_012026 [Geosiphon pyriformis]
MELFAVPGKTTSDKLISIKRIFYRVDDFGKASTLSKFLGIIKSFFTSELSLNMVKKLAVREKILVNNVIRKLNSHSNWKVIIKKISVDFSNSAVESVFSKFGKIVSIKMQLIGLWQKALMEFESLEIASFVASKWSVFMDKDSMRVALVINDKQSWVLRNQHWTLLYTLPVGTTAHDLSGLLNTYGKKTCFIGRNPSSYVYDRCAVICFVDETFKLVWVVTNQDQVCLTGIYKKKQALIARPVFFGGRTWAQVAGSFSFCVALLVPFGAAPFSAAKNSLLASALPGTYNLYGHLASLECSLELLANQVSGISVKLGSLKMVLLAAVFGVSLSEVPVNVVPGLNSDMVLNGELIVFTPSPLVVNDIAATISLSSSKVLTTKVSGLESKIVALEVLVESVLEKLNCLCSGLGLLAVFTSQ